MKEKTEANNKALPAHATARKVAQKLKRIFGRRTQKDGSVKHGAYYRRLEAMYTHPFFGTPPLYSGVMALIALLVIEGFGYKHLLGGFIFLANNPVAFLLNFLIIFATLSISWIFRRRWFVHSVLTSLWVVLGVVNGVVLTTRMTPFTTADFEVMDLGIEMFSVYLKPYQVALVGAVAAAGLVIFTLMFIKAPRRKPWGGPKPFLKALASVAVVFALLFSCWNISTRTGAVAVYFTNLWDAYTEYGMPYGFLSTWLRKGISRPVDYSRETVDAIFDKGELETTTSVTEPDKSDADFPNIIFLQLESFIDPTEVKGLTFSEDPTPFFRELKENYSTGYLRVPVIGGGTANTEFEAMTGMSCREFGPGEYPYKSVLKDKAVESMAFDLGELGYATHVIHNHRGAFYDRNKVFPMLGFDDFTSLEYMNYVTRTQRGFATDDVLTDEILGALAATGEHDYIYAISVQGHGEYPKEPLIKNPRIKVEGTTSESQQAAWEFYLDLIYDMDKFLEVLTGELAELDEDVALVLYGDHLPSLQINNEGVKSGDTFNTQYVLWSNFGLEKEDKNLSAYQLSAEVQRRLGLRQGLMTVFHQDKAGTPDYERDLHMLQYDILYGKNYIYGGESPYRKVDMTMGYRPIEVKEIVEVADEYYISGEGFTPFSKVTLDGKVLDTVYVGPTVLKLEEEVNPDSAKDMKISQVEKYNEILSTTE
ncbi:MAG: LTA synthase family protein [Clostridiales Family XIII bacterium]|jgi:phosphoglycerol transferase MdoB-like AlkP superfamily enzyme|nr:LTA synthase family protein [Clostridiales Family XIII bacterium]